MNSPARRALRARIAILVLIATLAHGLIPAGFMPSTGGGFALMLCPGHMVIPDSATGPHPGHGQHHSASICPFAAATLLGGAPSLASCALTHTALDLPLSFDSPSRKTGLSGPVRVQSPRAPPSFNS